MTSMQYSEGITTAQKTIMKRLREETFDKYQIAQLIMSEVRYGFRKAGVKKTNPAKITQAVHDISWSLISLGFFKQS